MSVKRIFSILLRQYFLYKSNPIRLISMFLWPFLTILQWGFLTKYLSSLAEDTFSFITVILGTVIIYEFMTRIINGIMTTFLEDVWSKNFLNIFSSPIKIEEYLLGLVLSSIIMGVVNFFIISLVSSLFFRYNILSFGFILWILLLNLFLFGVGLGFFITAVIFRLGPAAEWIGWPLPFILAVVSGVFYPISTLPKYLQSIAKILPTTYIFETMRGIILKNIEFKFVFYNINISFILSTIFLVINYLFFMKIYKQNLKSGVIARFSAFE
ncbi:MAG: ABC transporter permease [Endomicrobiia bacterium]